MKLQLLSVLLWQWGSVRGSECTDESCHQHLEDEVSLVQLKTDVKERKAGEDSAKPKITVVINTPTEPPFPCAGTMPPPVAPVASAPSFKTCATDPFVCPTTMNQKEEFTHLLCDAGQCTSDLCCENKDCLCAGGTAATGNTCVTPGGTQCLSCDDGYNLVAAACQANVCKCDHGIAATGADCTTDQGNICAGCTDAGYGLNADTKACEATCACADGTAATGSDCPTPGATKCSECNKGFKLTNDACQAIPKTCQSEDYQCPSNKLPKSDYDYLLCGDSCSTDRCCQDRACSYYTTEGTCPSSNPTCTWASDSATCEVNTGSSADVNCVVSDWGAWGTCISSSQIRTRSITTYPKNNGNACPEISEEGTCSSVGGTENTAGAIGQST
jgi:hypothetical protein